MPLTYKNVPFLIFVFQIITLKRFEATLAGVKKCSKLVEFPLNGLSLQSHMRASDHCNASFDLFAVINHFGAMNKGHYYAYCKMGGEKWYEANDSDCSVSFVTFL